MGVHVPTEHADCRFVPTSYQKCPKKAAHSYIKTILTPTEDASQLCPTGGEERALGVEKAIGKTKDQIRIPTTARFPDIGQNIFFFKQPG